jgi:hypothetical protein
VTVTVVHWVELVLLLGILGSLYRWAWLATGKVAAEYGEDPRFWRMRMVPLAGALAPWWTRLAIERRRGGGDGPRAV